MSKRETGNEKGRGVERRRNKRGWKRGKEERTKTNEEWKETN